MGNTLTLPCHAELVSDGYHTFRELYEHRNWLFLAFMHAHPTLAFITKKHHDGTMFDGFFLAGMSLPIGNSYRQISYHLELKYWDCCVSMGLRVLECGPAFDGHTSQDVLLRIEDYLLGK